MYMKHSCKQVSQLVSDAHERSLSLTERLRLRLHIILCWPCRNYEQDILLLTGTLKRMQASGPDTSACLSEQGYQRIQQALREASK